jgi:hypothetical protein
MRNAQGLGPLKEPIPRRFTIATGDWLECSARLPEPNNRERWYKVEIETQGDAMEKIASVRPARFISPRTFDLQAGRADPLTMVPIPANGGGPSERHHFLRGKRAGKATIRTTVTRDVNWKEVREFEVTVTEQREVAQSLLRFQ